MKNVAFHSLLRWKMTILPILTTTLLRFSLGVGRMYFLKLGVKGLCTASAIRCFLFSTCVDLSFLGQYYRTGARESDLFRCTSPDHIMFRCRWIPVHFLRVQRTRFHAAVAPRGAATIPIHLCAIARWIDDYKGNFPKHHIIFIFPNCARLSLIN